MATALIRPAAIGDLAEIVRMRVALWPDCAPEASSEARAIVEGRAPGKLPLTLFVAERSGGGLCGFVEVGLRSHSDSCDPARPVGFVEGWYVDAGRRRAGVGRALVRAAEEWSRAQGCTEMASDAQVDNAEAHRAHAALGFEIADRVVVFRKAL